MRKGHRNYVRQITALMLCVITAAGIFCGCQKSGAPDSESGAKGRYVEKDIELPTEKGEEVLNLIKSKEGNPVLFSCLDGTKVFRYEYKDGEWKKSSLDWLDGLYKEKDVYFMEVQESADGAQLVRGTDDEALTHIARSGDGKTGAELNIPYLKQKGETGYPGVMELQIDSDGNYWMNDMYQSRLVVISADSLDVTEEINTVQCFSGEQRVVYTAENGDMAVNTEEGRFTLYDSKLNEKEKLKVSQEGLLQMCSRGDSWYSVSEQGIVRMAPGNEVSEVLMDGSMGAMGSSTNTPIGMTAGEEEFYVLYRQDKASAYRLCRYTYDEEASAVPEHTLRVFGLSENDTVREAVIGFQKLHSDVKVEFQTAGSGEELSADDIRTLNTELLGGNGADILLLDGLPVDSYAEKGVLADMTKFVKELTGQADYLEEVLGNTARKDGKIYGIPVKFSVPVIYGNEEVKKALSSLETLSKYLDKNPEANIFGVAERGYIRDFLFQLYQDEILGTDKKIDKEKMALLFELEKKIAVNARAEVFDKFASGEMAIGTGTMNQIFSQSMFTNPGGEAILNHPESVTTERIASISNMMVPYAIMRRLKLSPETVKDFYVPKGIIGINSNTEQRELAEEFVKYLFSEEIQGAQLDDGFPVLLSSLENIRAEADSDYAKNLMVGSSLVIDGEDHLDVEAGYPEKKEIEDLIDMCKSLKTPAVQDCTIWNIYQTEADECLKGSIDEETAAKNIAQKVDTYLAE